MSAADRTLEAGLQALERGEWARAREVLQDVVAMTADPEAHDALGVACWWLDELADAQRHRAGAYLGYLERGEPGRAARVAAWLAREQSFLDGNDAATRGWFARALRLVEEGGTERDAAWVHLFRASLHAPPAELLATAERAADTGRRERDGDLCALALAFAGAARVRMGEVAEGMASLDEALAACLAGEVRDRAVVSESLCLMLAACEAAGDHRRAEEWCRTAEGWARRHGGSFLAAYCRTTLATLLTAAGRWREAEEQLLAALRIFESAHRGLRVRAQVRLADLLVREHRLEEADVLLAGLEADPSAAVPLARLHLARDERDLARAVIERRLRVDHGRSAGRVEALLLQAEILRHDDASRANDAAREALAIATALPSVPLQAQAELLLGRLARGRDDPAAREWLERALGSLERYESALLAARARLEMAHVLADEDRAGAVMWARAARTTFERLGAARDADEAAALLRRLGAPPGPRGRAGGDARVGGDLTEREREVLALVAAGLSNRDIAARLVISPKTAEHHVTRILSKLGVRSRAGAAALAARLASPGDGRARP